MTFSAMQWHLDARRFNVEHGYFETLRRAERKLVDATVESLSSLRDPR